MRYQTFEDFLNFDKVTFYKFDYTFCSEFRTTFKWCFIYLNVHLIKIFLCYMFHISYHTKSKRHLQYPIVPI